MALSVYRNLGVGPQTIGGLYSVNGETRRQAVLVIIGKGQGRVSQNPLQRKSHLMRMTFSGKNTVSADCIDPRILAAAGPGIKGGANSNDSILAALIQNKTGYIPLLETTIQLSSEVGAYLKSLPEVSHEELLQGLLPKEELCEFLGINSLQDFNLNLHVRAAYKFFILKVIEAANRALPYGQLSAEITQFGPVKPEDIDAEKIGVPADFVKQFQVPTLEEMVADGIVMDGGHDKTLIKVATGHIDSYRVISELYNLGLAPNATLGFPTLQDFTDAFGITWKYTGELAIACQLGAITNSFFIRRTAGHKAHGEEVAWAFAGESIKFAEEYGIVATAASIGDGPMAFKALKMGSHIVATPPHKVGKDIYDFIRWCAEDVPKAVEEAQHVVLPERREVVPFDEYLRHGFTTVSSPLLKAGYTSFLEDHIRSAWTVAQHIIGEK